jgi:hypothetical protein
MSFWDEVYKLREQGLIPRVWTRECLRPHLLGPYTPNSINTIPSNQSITRDGKEIGNYVKHGRDPKAWRVGRGEFQLVVDPDDDEATRETERLRAKAYSMLARNLLSGSPYPLRGIPLKYDHPFEGIDFYEQESQG